MVLSFEMIEEKLRIFIKNRYSKELSKFISFILWNDVPMFSPRDVADIFNIHNYFPLLIPLKHGEHKRFFPKENICNAYRIFGKYACFLTIEGVCAFVDAFIERESIDRHTMNKMKEKLKSFHKFYRSFQSTIPIEENANLSFSSQYFEEYEMNIRYKFSAKDSSILMICVKDLSPFLTQSLLSVAPIEWGSTTSNGKTENLCFISTPHAFSLMRKEPSSNKNLDKFIEFVFCKILPSAYETRTQNNIMKANVSMFDDPDTMKKIFDEWYSMKKAPQEEKPIKKESAKNKKVEKQKKPTKKKDDLCDKLFSFKEAAVFLTEKCANKITDIDVINYLMRNAIITCCSKTGKNGRTRNIYSPAEGRESEVVVIIDEKYRKSTKITGLCLKMLYSNMNTKASPR